MVVATLAAVSATSLPVGVLGYCDQLDQQFREFVVHDRGFAAMVEVENEWCFVCVEGQVAGEWGVLQLFGGNVSDFEGVTECWHLEQYV